MEEKKSCREMRREKKYPAEHVGGKKYPAHQVARKKKNLLTRNHPPTSKVKWSAPNENRAFKQRTTQTGCLCFPSSGVKDVAVLTQGFLGQYLEPYIKRFVVFPFSCCVSC